MSIPQTAQKSQIREIDARVIVYTNIKAAYQIGWNWINK